MFEVRKDFEQEEETIRVEIKERICSAVPVGIDEFGKWKMDTILLIVVVAFEHMYSRFQCMFRNKQLVELWSKEDNFLNEIKKNRMTKGD